MERSLQTLGSVRYCFAAAGSEWSLLSPAGSAPGGRSSMSAVWSPADGRMYVFGGNDGTALNDLHYYESGTNNWHQINVQQPPEGRANHVAIWSQAEGRMYVFGGESASGRLNDLQAFSQASTGSFSLTAGTCLASRKDAWAADGCGCG